MAQTPKELVLQFIHALNKEDFVTAASCLADNMVFDGVMGKRNGAEAYMSDMKKMKFKYDIQRSFEDGDEVCLLYTIDMSGQASIFTCGWYQTAHGKITTLKVVFDPRPLLEKEEKK
ncbi:MAG: nuclear transport factor 2 family protein [Bacteroidota bacterium]